MKISSQTIARCLAAATIFSCGNLFAEANISWGVTITGGTPPPVMRHEPMPPPRAGYVWMQGYWGWQGGAHVWIPGRWERERVGHVYVQPAWREGPKGWELHPGGWHSGGKGGGKKGGGHCPPGQQKKGNC